MLQKIVLSYRTVLVNTVFKNILNFISRPSDPKTFTMWSLARWSLRLLTALVLPHGCKGGRGEGESSWILLSLLAGFHKVMEGIHKAIELGYSPVKVRMRCCS